jgi:hypothetical protein
MFQRLVSAAFAIATLALSSRAMAQSGGGAGNNSDLGVSTIFFVPEPGTLSLLIGGLACVALLRSRRKP